MNYSSIKLKLDELIKNNPEDCRVYGVFSLDTVQKLENDLGVSLPQDYQAFLKDYGAIDFFGIEIYGLTQIDYLKDTSIPSTFWMTESERKQGLPSKYVVIGVSGDGTTYAIDTESMEIVGYSNYKFENNNFLKIFNSFNDFLLEQINSAEDMI